MELESVQRRFTRLIDGIGTMRYSERLEALQLTTLAERRIRGDLIEVFKIVNGLAARAAATQLNKCLFSHSVAARAREGLRSE